MAKLWARFDPYWSQLRNIVALSAVGELKEIPAVGHHVKNFEQAEWVRPIICVENEQIVKTNEKEKNKKREQMNAGPPAIYILDSPISEILINDLHL